MSLLNISNLSIAIQEKHIVKGITLAINPGEIHAIMGPNGSGKSTLVSTLMGHPTYTVTSGTATLNGENLCVLSTDERARRGLFLAMQYPKEIPGVTLFSLLLASAEAQRKERNPHHKKLSPIKFRREVEEAMTKLKMNPSFIDRPVNHGFSGGEKKKAEILQMMILNPSISLLDETDSGLDVDALRIVADGVNSMRSSTFSAMIVTHYARLLEYIKPDFIHIMVNGTIVRSGGSELAYELEREGYAQYGKNDNVRIELSTV